MTPRRMIDQAPNRRPIKSRALPVVQSAGRWLANADVTPNAISLSSIAFGVVAGVALALTAQVDSNAVTRALWFFAAVCVQLRLLANLLDGLVAVEGGKKTATGELFNEAPDRVADTAILVGAGFAAGSAPWLGAAASIVALFVAYVRALGASAGAGQVFAGPMAKPQRMAIVTGVAIYNTCAPLGWQPVDSAGRGVPAAALLIVVIGGLWTAWRRLRLIAKRLNDGATE